MSHIPRIPPQTDAAHPADGPSGPASEADHVASAGGLHADASPSERRGGGGPHGPHGPGAGDGREPVLMLPGAVVAMVALITLVHFARSFLSPERDVVVQLWFAFIPARYVAGFFPFPGGIAADVWTFVTYALLHGSWVHLITNAVWLVAFGSAVSRRFGAVRFWVFSAVAAAGGAALHLALHMGDPIPVVGASAAIAGQMAAAARFVFDAGGPMVLRRGGTDDRAFKRPAASLADTFRNRSALLFIVIWFGINLAVGLGSSVSGGQAIAWEAHIGGFLVGLLLFRIFDPVPPR